MSDSAANVIFRADCTSAADQENSAGFIGHVQDAACVKVTKTSGGKPQVGFPEAHLTATGYSESKSIGGPSIDAEVEAKTQTKTRVEIREDRFADQARQVQWRSIC